MSTYRIPIQDTPDNIGVFKFPGFTSAQSTASRYWATASQIRRYSTSDDGYWSMNRYDIRMKIYPRTSSGGARSLITVSDRDALTYTGGPGQSGPALRTYSPSGDSIWCVCQNGTNIEVRCYNSVHSVSFAALGLSVGSWGWIRISYDLSVLNFYGSNDGVNWSLAASISTGGMGVGLLAPNVINVGGDPQGLPSGTWSASETGGFFGDLAYLSITVPEHTLPRLLFDPLQCDVSIITSDLTTDTGENYLPDSGESYPDPWSWSDEDLWLRITVDLICKSFDSIGNTRSTYWSWSTKATYTAPPAPYWYGYQGRENFFYKILPDCQFTFENSATDGGSDDNLSGMLWFEVVSPNVGGRTFTDEPLSTSAALWSECASHPKGWSPDYIDDIVFSVERSGNIVSFDLDFFWNNIPAKQAAISQPGTIDNLAADCILRFESYRGFYADFDVFNYRPYYATKYFDRRQNFNYNSKIVTWRSFYDLHSIFLKYGWTNWYKYVQEGEYLPLSAGPGLGTSGGSPPRHPVDCSYTTNNMDVVRRNLNVSGLANTPYHQIPAYNEAVELFLHLPRDGSTSASVGGNIFLGDEPADGSVPTTYDFEIDLSEAYSSDFAGKGTFPYLFRTRLSTLDIGEIGRGWKVGFISG